MLKTDYDKFSVTTLTERGENFERINQISLNVNCFPIITIKYHEISEHNAPCDLLRVIIHYSDILADGINWGSEAVKFLENNIGCVTKSHADKGYCSNLIYHAINNHWLVSDEYLESLNIEACEYYPKKYTCYQYNQFTDETTREIRVIIL